MEECEFAETLYSYDGDKLLSYGDEACVYADAVGNPTVYRGKTAGWERGRLLNYLDGNNFSYDGQGRRIKKNNTVFTYDGEGNLVKQSDGLEFVYDTNGLSYVKYNNAVYFYRKDAQGNIIALLDNSGNVVVKYVYDAWGNHAVLDANGADITDVNHIGVLNPFRYRGYYYDTETELYYLQTRYYDPETGRFITIDGIEYLDPETINGLNLYAYCGNNPVMNVDPTGHAFLVFLIAALIGFGVSFGASAVTQAINNEGEVDWGVAVIDGLFGAASGALWMIPGLGPVATGLINVGLTAVNGILTTGIENNWQFAAMDFVAIGFSALVSGAVSGITRGQFISAGSRQVLNKTHKFVGTVSKRIVTGYYNNGVDIFSKSFKSAFGQMWNQVIGLNFGEGFWKEWLITLLQSISSASFSRGLNGIQW